MKVLLALDKFKFSMSAEQACDVIEKTRPDWHCVKRPLTDGGEGFCEILTHVAGGEIHEIEVTGPIGEKTTARIGFVSAAAIPEKVKHLLSIPDLKDTIAIVEMAQASGIQLLSQDEQNPWNTTTYGTGELLNYAKKQGVQAILLGLGGSATSDLGLGALQALGLQCTWRTTHQEKSYYLPKLWSQIKDFHGNLNDLPTLRIACDVQNPLLGKTGAAHVFGPQKGLPLDDIQLLDGLAENMADKLISFRAASPKLKEYAGSGAAGGIGFGLKTCYAAEFVSGFELVQSWLDLDTQIASCDFIITGEGKFDQSSLDGKGPYSLIEKAQFHKRPVIVLAGCLDENVGKFFDEKSWDVQAFAITPKETELNEAFRRAPEFLAQTVEKIVLK